MSSFIVRNVENTFHMYWTQFGSEVQFSCSDLSNSFVTLWTTARQASLSITISWSLLKLMSIETVMPSNHLILCRPLLLPPSFPASRSFPRSYFLASGGQSIGVSASTSVLSINIQDWFPLGLTGWIFTTLEYRLEGLTQSEQQKEKFFKWA